MDNAIYEGMVITILAAGTTCSMLTFCLAQKQVHLLSEKQSERKRREYVAHRYKSECSKQILLPTEANGIQYRTETSFTLVSHTKRSEGDCGFTYRAQLSRF
jgi:hypothetical protein